MLQSYSVDTKPETTGEFMLELLNGVGKKGGGYFPNSGPGSKYLEYGDENVGYFGEVSSEQLFSDTDLGTLLNFQKGVPLTGPVVWIKYIFQKRVCFTPKKELRTTISWNDLYDAGLIYGVDGLGNYPNGAGVNQLKVVTKGSTFFKARLFSISPVDPAPVYSGTYPVELREGEWFKLLAPMLKYRLAGYEGDLWNLYDSYDLTHSKNSHVQETRAIYNTNSIAISTTITNPTTTAKTTISVDYAWRPVLEVVDGSGMLLEHHPVEYDADGLFPVGGIDYDGSTAVVRSVEDTGYQGLELFTVGSISSSTEPTVKLTDGAGMVYLGLYPLAHDTHSIT